MRTEGPSVFSQPSIISCFMRLTGSRRKDVARAARPHTRRRTGLSLGRPVPVFRALLLTLLMAAGLLVVLGDPEPVSEAFGVGSAEVTIAKGDSFSYEAGLSPVSDDDLSGDSVTINITAGAGLMVNKTSLLIGRLGGLPRA